jgi:hypothetical protein
MTGPGNREYLDKTEAYWMGWDSESEVSDR